MLSVDLLFVHKGIRVAKDQITLTTVAEHRGKFGNMSARSEKTSVAPWNFQKIKDLLWLKFSRFLTETCKSSTQQTKFRHEKIFFSISWLSGAGLYLYLCTLIQQTTIFLWSAISSDWLNRLRRLSFVNQYYLGQ